MGTIDAFQQASSHLLKVLKRAVERSIGKCPSQLSVLRKQKQIHLNIPQRAQKKA
jgi:hypothetical protein